MSHKWERVEEQTDWQQLSCTRPGTSRQIKICNHPECRLKGVDSLQCKPFNYRH
ncbi:hypothetical protein JXJ21_08005 [candidate division KSB1 bacterium]|nr:hypothetical protein [candidate division KSB1 bacterium]